MLWSRDGDNEVAGFRQQWLTSLSLRRWWWQARYHRILPNTEKGFSEPMAIKCLMTSRIEWEVTVAEKCVRHICVVFHLLKFYIRERRYLFLRFQKKKKKVICKGQYTTHQRMITNYLKAKETTVPLLRVSCCSVTFRMTFLSTVSNCDLSHQKSAIKFLIQYREHDGKIFFLLYCYNA